MLLLRHLSRATRPTAATQFSAQKRRFATGFFEEQVFWKQASIGPFCWLLALSFPLYRAWKDLYWTMNMRSLNKSEIIADRYEWLQQSMLQDEVDAVLPGPLYRAWKDLYWTMNMHSLNKSEIIADRYEWLQQSMLQDEVDAVCALQAGKYA